MTPAPKKSPNWKALSGRKIFVPPGLDQKNELDRTCAMLSALDVLVSAPTAVSWLGAGAGVPTLKILYDTSWTGVRARLMNLSRRPAICVMPQTRGDWADAFAQGARRLSRSFDRLLFLPSAPGPDRRRCAPRRRHPEWQGPAAHLAAAGGIVHQGAHRAQYFFVASPASATPSDTPMPASPKAEAERA